MRLELLANSETGRKGRLGTALAALPAIINFNVRKALGSLLTLFLGSWEALGSLLTRFLGFWEALGSLLFPVSLLKGSREPLIPGFPL